MIELHFPSASSTCRKLLPWFTVTKAARSSNLGHRTHYVLSCTGRKRILCGGKRICTV
jgi:hypothetical protein